MEKKPILYLLDDYGDMRELIQKEMEARNVEVVTFADGQSLFKHLKQEKKEPTVILLDYQLDPEMPIGSVLKKLKKEYRQIPLIIYTGNKRHDAADEYRMGVYALMMKPIDFGELKVIVNELAGRNELFQRIAEDVMALVPQFNSCLVWELDKKSYTYRVVAWKGQLNRKYQKEVTFDPDEAPWVHNLKHGDPYYAEDILAQKRYYEYQHPEYAQEWGWRTLITIPLVRNGRVLGWVDCYSSKINALEDKLERTRILEVLKHFSHQASETLHAEALTRQLRLSHEITQRLTWTYDETELFKTILDKASEYLGNDYACLYQLDFLNQSWKQEPIYHRENKDKNAPALPQDFLDRVLQKVYEGQTEIMDDVEIVLQGVAKYRPLISMVGIPIRRAESQVLGILILMSERKKFFTIDDLQLLQTLAASAAVVIDQVKTTQHLQQIGKLAQNNQSEKELAQYVVNAASDLTHADVIFWRPSDKENEGDEYMRIFTHSENFIPDELLDTKVPNDPKESANALALYKKEPIIYANITKGDNDNPFFHQGSIDTYGWKSFFGVPLLGKHAEQLGVLSLYGREPDYFKKERNRLIEHFAGQTALALQEQKHLAYLQDLNSISQALNSYQQPQIKDLLQKVVDLGITISRADTTVLYPFSNRKKDHFDLDLVVFAGPARSNREELVDRPKQDGIANITRKYGILMIEDIKDQNGTIQTYGDAGGVITLNDQERKQLYARLGKSMFLEQENIGSFIAVALRAYEDSEKRDQNLDVGVMYFNYRAPRDFDPELIQVIHIFARQTANIIYRNRLNINLQKQKDLLEGVNLASVSILEQKEPQAQLNKIIAQGVNLLKAKGGKIYRTVGMYKDAQLVAGTSLPKQVKVGHIIPSGQGLVGEVIKTKLAKWENNYPFYQNHYGNFKDLFSAVVEVPLLDQDEVIGVLSIFDDNKRREFTEADAQILEKLSAIAVLAIKQADLNTELVNLYSTGLTLQSQDKVATVAQTILDNIESVIPCDRATIQLIVNTRSQRSILAHKGYNKRNRDPYLLRPVEQDELLKSILASKKPHVISDTSQNPLWDGHLTEIASINSWICLPLISKGNVFGIITIDHYIPGFYTEKVVEKLQLFGSQASLALQRAVLTDIIQEQKTSFEGAISELTHGITSSKNTLEFYNSLADSALKLFNGAHLVEIYILAENKTKLKRQGSAGMKKTKGTDILIQVDVTRGMVGKVLATKEPVLVVDAENDDFQSVTPGTHSAILAPILQGDQIVGLLSIEHPEKDGVDEEDQRIAKAICNLAAISKERGDLLHNLQLLESFLKSIKEVETAKPEEGIDTIFAMLIEAIYDINVQNIQGCYFFLEDKKFFDPKKIKALLKGQGKSRKNIKLIKLNLGIGFISSLYQTGKPQIIQNTNEIEIFKTFANAAEIAVTPLLNNGAKIGLLCVIGKSQGEFSDQELNVLEGLTLLSEGKIHQFDQYRIKQEAFARGFNPYIVGDIIEDQKMFFGREDISSKIINGIHNNHFFVEGERRIGKSSLIRHLFYRLRLLKDDQYKFFPAIFDLQGLTKGQFFTIFIRSVIQGLGLINELGSPDLNIKLPQLKEQYDFNDLKYDLETIINFLELENSEKEIRIVIFMDEIQILNAFGSKTIEQLRAVLLNSNKLKAVMMGTEQIINSIRRKTSPFNIHKTIKLNALSKHEAIKLIIEPVENVYEFEKNTIDVILDASMLKPMNIQEICRGAVEHMLARNKNAKTNPQSQLKSLIVIREDVDYGIKELQNLLLELMQKDASA
jgi:GAF domain-containing protein/DNA-binding response OmpR family regulator